MRDTGQLVVTPQPSSTVGDWEDGRNGVLTVTGDGRTSGMWAAPDADGFWRPVVALLDPETGTPCSDVVDGRATGEAHASVRACLLAAVGRVP